MVPIQLRPGRPALPRGPGSVRGPDGRRGSRRPERHAGACARPRPSSLSWATFGGHEGRSNGAIAGILVVSERGVEKHVGNIFSKLGLAPSDADHRRVLAVLRYLES